VKIRLRFPEWAKNPSIFVRGSSRSQTSYTGGQRLGVNRAKRLHIASDVKLQLLAETFFEDAQA